MVETAVSDQSGVTSFDLPAKEYSVGRISPDGGLTVRVTTLDEFVFQGRAPIPNQIKINVEGAEAKVLQGALRLLREERPIVYRFKHTEKAVGAPEEVFRQCCDVLTSCGYQWSSLDMPSVAYKAFVGYPAELEFPASRV